VIVADYLRQDAVAGTNFPVIEPNVQPVLPHPLHEGADDSFVLRAMTEDVKGESIRRERQARFGV